jgi:EAL domain-containing protein (putative c-di-GMP-specific phosphodiesterase class I)
MVVGINSSVGRTGPDGALAAAALGSVSGAARQDHYAERRRIRDLIHASAFEPVYQPVVDIGRGSVLGHQLLTRFHDGLPPERQFASAASVGLGRQLELATLQLGVAAAHALPPDRWLSVTVSPELVIAPTMLGRVLAAAGDRHLVLELAEHREASDFARVRSVVNALELGVAFAIDDARAGYASFRHILELGPAYVTIGSGIVRGLDADPARQALVAGFRYFADVSGCEPIAEGIETESERRALRQLGIVLGRGRLFGGQRPATHT